MCYNITLYYYVNVIYYYYYYYYCSCCLMEKRSYQASHYAISIASCLFLSLRPQASPQIALNIPTFLTTRDQASCPYKKTRRNCNFVQLL